MGSEKNKSKRAVVLAMIALSAIVVIVSYFYYGGENDKVDPRIKPAREMYIEYNKVADQNNFVRAFRLIDSINQVYLSVDHYKNSFERGVLMNNKGAAIITIAMVKDSTDNAVFPQEYQNLDKDSLIQIAGVFVNQSIELYTSWFKHYENKKTEELRRSLEAEFLIGLESYDSEQKHGFLENRLEEIRIAVLEKDRRLSVSYTNLGMIYRHQKEYDKAIEAYSTAMELWNDNLTAQNNMNVLLGRPLKKNSPIRKFFPKNKNEGL